MSRSSTFRALIAALAALVILPASASALPGARVSATKLVKHVNYPDTQHLHYEYGPIQILPGQNNIEARINRNKPTVPGYITRFDPEPRVLRRAQDPARRCDPSPSRGLAEQRLPDLRRRRGEDGPAVPARLRLPLPPERRLDHELHDPQPHAASDEGVDHLRHRLRPGLVRDRSEAHGGPSALDGRVGHQRVSGVRRAEGSGPEAASSRSPTRRAPPSRTTSAAPASTRLGGT